MNLPAMRAMCIDPALAPICCLIRLIREISAWETELSTVTFRVPAALSMYQAVPATFALCTASLAAVS